jgi:glycerol-3-phosphate dehydrogenase (NAD(P)+)
MKPETTAVLGSGSWGTTLAVLLAKKGIPIHLWCHNPELAEILKIRRENPTYLPGITIPSQVEVYYDLEEALDGAGVVIVAIPSQYVESVMEKAASVLNKKTIIVSASKGIEVSSLRRVTQIIEAYFPYPEQILVISGPNFSVEVARGLPTAAVAAGCHTPNLTRIQSHLTTPMFRVYTNTDPIGCELGGALKNVIAIACGVADGLDLGLNARSALITRGLAEITRLGVALGAEALTFLGLAGVGDLVLTCTGNLSRNRRVGLEIGKGKSIEEVLEGMKMVAEGVKTAISARNLSRKTGVEMPISEEVYLLLHENKNPRRAVEDLMKRGLKQEAT